MRKPILIAAGGTGGHFFPAEALASHLLALGERVVLMTDARSGALASPVFSQAERHVIAGAGLSGRSLKRALAGAFALARGVVQARAIMARAKPGAVVAFGGYPAVAPVIAAFSLRPRPKILLHEQNAVLGRANRLLARLADVVVLSFAKTQALPKFVKTELLGNPVRGPVAELFGVAYQPPDAQFNILVLGGSLGAQFFGALIPQAMALLPPPLRARLHVVQQCRLPEQPAAQRVFAESGIAAELSPFFEDIAARLAVAHLVIARAGASSVAEIAVAGRPAIFIPLPNAIDDHQRANADALASLGAAWRLDQAGLTPEILAAKIESLLMNTTFLVNAASAAAGAARPGAAQRLAELVQAMVGAER